jgi:hypothetical protein
MSGCAQPLMIAREMCLCVAPITSAALYGCGNKAKTGPAVGPIIDLDKALPVPLEGSNDHFSVLLVTIPTAPYW